MAVKVDSAVAIDPMADSERVKGIRLFVNLGSNAAAIARSCHCPLQYRRQCR